MNKNYLLLLLVVLVLLLAGCAGVGDTPEAPMCFKYPDGSFLYNPSGATMSYVQVDSKIVFTLTYRSDLVTIMTIDGNTRIFEDYVNGVLVNTDTFDLSAVSGTIELNDTANTEQKLDYGKWNLDTATYTEPPCPAYVDTLDL